MPKLPKFLDGHIPDICKWYIGNRVSWLVVVVVGSPSLHFFFKGSCHTIPQRLIGAPHVCVWISFTTPTYKKKNNFESTSFALHFDLAPSKGRSRSPELPKAILISAPIK